MQQRRIKVVMVLIMLIQISTIAHVYAQDGYAHEGMHLDGKRTEPLQNHEQRHSPRSDFNKQRLKEELMALPPAQRAARLQELKEEHLQRCAAREKKLEEKWQNADAEERAFFCQKLQQKCQQENKKFACDLARDKCRE
jgi:hypothetical protein